MKKGFRIRLVFMSFGFLIFNIVILGSIFSLSSNQLEIRGKKDVDRLSFSIEELRAQPPEAIIEGYYHPNGFGGEKVYVKGVKLSYLLEKKCGINVKDCDVLFFSTNDKPYGTQSYSEILDVVNGYVVAYEINNIPVESLGINNGFQIYRHKDALFQHDTVFKLVKNIKLPVEFSLNKMQNYSLFIDITDSNKYAEEAINYMAMNNMINGMSGSKFEPSGRITRAQFSKLVVEAIKYGKTDYTGRFSDVSHDSWYAEYISSVVKYGLFTGYEDGSFKPEQGINRQELATVLSRLAIKEGLITREQLNRYSVSKTNFVDKASIGGWAGSAVAWLDSQGNLSAFTGDSFYPLKETTRAEATYLIYKILFE